MRRKKDQNKEQNTAKTYPDICDIEEKRPVHPIFEMNVYEIDNVADPDFINQITECAGKDDKKRQMTKKRPSSDVPDDINDK